MIEIENSILRNLEAHRIQREETQRELNRVESRFHNRISEAKMDNEKDITQVRGEVAQVKMDIEKDLREVQLDLRDDIKGIRTHITALTVLGVTSLLTLIGLFITVFLK